MRVEETNSVSEVTGETGHTVSNDSVSKNERDFEVEKFEARDRIAEDKLDQDLIEANKKEIEEELNTLNEFVRYYDKQLNFELHENSDRHYVQVIDVIEDKIIREIPPEKILDMIARINDLMGLIIDERI